MSARPKTSNSELVWTAKLFLEEGGLEALSMQAVAEHVGIKAPSLYKRFTSRNDLLRAVLTDALEGLHDRVEASLGPDCRATLRRMAHTYREWARSSPRLYELMFSMNLPADADPGDEARNAVARPMLRILADVRGGQEVLEAGRLLVSYLHGFVSLEIAERFRLGGNIDESFAFGLEKLLDTLVPKAV